MQSLLESATDAQRAAITHLSGPLLVLAGPGSGKTRVVTHRIAWLIEQGVPAGSILAITFTNKAAQEMRERVARLHRADGIWVSTFHSMGARMLRRGAERVGLDSSFTIYDSDDQTRIVRDLMRSQNIDTTQFRPGAVLSAISRWKTDLVRPGAVSGRARSFFEDVAAKVYPAYEKRLAESNAVDFDDLLVKCLDLLRENEDVRNHYRDRFQFVLVDEYQDTNQVQYLLLHTLAEPKKNLHVTGDPDQAIYGFRGADISNILKFEENYPEARVVRLEENFRSTAHILRGADSLIQKNKRRKGKRLIGTRGDGSLIRLLECVDEDAESESVASAVKDKLTAGVSPREIAIFYRVHALSRSLERSFIDRGIPYTIVRGTEFFRRAEVQDLLAYLKVVFNPRDNESLLRIVNVPTRGIGKTSVARLIEHARRRGISLRQTLVVAAEVEGLPKRSGVSAAKLGMLFDSLTTDADARPVSDVMEGLVQAIDLKKHLKSKYPDNHEDRWENVAQLVSSAAEFQEKNPEGGLGGYLEEVSLLSDADQHDSEAERVSFMTLHTAKGLEFDVAYIVGLEKGLLPHSRASDSPEEMEEERRLLFVGMTRAKEELTLSHARERFRWGQRGFASKSSFLEEIDASAIEQLPDPHGFVADRHYEVDAWVEPDPTDSLRSGMMVRHGTFGVGRVTGLSGTGAGTRVTVDFRNYGPKKLILMYAKLAPLDAN